MPDIALVAKCVQLSGAFFASPSGESFGTSAQVRTGNNGCSAKRFSRAGLFAEHFGYAVVFMIGLVAEVLGLLIAIATAMQKNVATP